MRSNAKRPTVILADDNAAVHPLISRILQPEMDIVEHVFDGHALVEAVTRICPDLVIVDVFMPVMDGVEAVRRVLARYPKLAAVLISTDTSEPNMQRASMVGAHALVHKGAAAEELLPAARAALRGNFTVQAPVRAPS